jgi:hypothetical protein
MNSLEVNSANDEKIREEILKQAGSVNTDSDMVPIIQEDIVRRVRIKFVPRRN